MTNAGFILPYLAASARIWIWSGVRDGKERLPSGLHERQVSDWLDASACWAAFMNHA